MSVVDFRRASVVDWLCGHVSQGGRAILVWAKMGEKALRRKFERSGPCTPHSKFKWCCEPKRAGKYPEELPGGVPIALRIRPHWPVKGRL